MALKQHGDISFTPRKYEVKRDAGPYAKRDRAPRWSPRDSQPQHGDYVEPWDPMKAGQEREEEPPLVIDLRPKQRASARVQALRRRQMRRL